MQTREQIKKNSAAVSYETYHIGSNPFFISAVIAPNNKIWLYDKTSTSIVKDLPQNQVLIKPKT